MNFRDLPVKDRLAVLGLIDALEEKCEAERVVAQKFKAYQQAAEYLTSLLVIQEVKGGEVTYSPIPEQFALKYKDRCYLITIDVEGDNNHEIRDIEQMWSAI